MREALQDRAARQVIAHELGQNLMVLAGAGAGKTHELIERMVGCVCSGQAPVERLVAITFTRKAAGELRGRFAARLREAQTGPAAALARQALERIDQCFIGTIHAFCGQLLRERPLEAQVPADFSELEEREETRLRRAAWDRFVQRGYLQEDRRFYEIEELGLQPEDLFPFFSDRCRFAELPLKGGAVPCPDLRPAVEAARELVERTFACLPAGVRADAFMQTLARAQRFLEYGELRAEGDRADFLKLLAGKQAITLKNWAPHQEFARTLRDEVLPQFQEQVLAPALRQWRQYVYSQVVGLVDEAMRFYEEQRCAAGRLIFQDLLARAASLLRRHPQVRQYFQQRYGWLFVDEFQDTDPVQAEVVLYLTGTELEEEDWRCLRPRPGSLFLVGDEKQSIYRFRRADVETFRLVRDRIAASGGKVVELTTSFRAAGQLCEWLNQVFAPLFAEHPARYQALFAPLGKNRPAGADPLGVRRLSLPPLKGHRRALVAAQDAERIGEFIGAAMAGQTGFNGDGTLGEHASPGDFLILTRTTAQLTTYARALEARGIPYDISGSRLGDSPDLKALVEMLEAVAAPEEALRLVNYLRGPLVGLGDDELYACRGRFDCSRPLPDGLSAQTRQRLEEALGRLCRARQWLEEHTPGTALAWITEELGFIQFAASRPLGSSRAGGLLRVLALVRHWEAQGMHWVQILREMRELIDDPEYQVEEMTLETGQSAVVRLMNLHQAKGLQARVVFLADPCDTSPQRHEVDCHVSRAGAAPFLSLRATRPRGPHGVELIAEPAGWEEDAEEERRFLRAEELRLVYVAATRARDLLVISRYEGKPDSGPWSLLYPALEQVPELPRCAAPLPLQPQSLPLDREEWQRERRQRWSQLQRPSRGPISL